MKFLYITTIGGTMTFFRKLVRELIEVGHTVDIAANIDITDVPHEYYELGCKVHKISCVRTPFNKGNIVAVKQLKQIVANGNYDVVHCHTPIAAAVTRIACKGARKQGLQVMYTAHGFHFYKGAPLVNWLLYYPVEKLCARWTDVLITINQEDYERAKKKLKAKRIEYVPGVGIDVSRFTDAVVDKPAKRNEIGVPEEAFLILSVGELNHNKNHEVIIRAVAELNNPAIHYAIAGKGKLGEYLMEVATDLGVKDQFHLLGYRTDVPELYKCAEICAFPSIREGLGLAAIEGIASGLPLVVSNNRGAQSYAVDNKNSIICPIGNNPTVYANAINRLLQDEQLRHMMREYNLQTVSKYEVKNINVRMKKIYGI